MIDLQKYMSIAIDEARFSLREGNSGFGAVIVKDDKLIAQAHDTDSTDGDPTAHAEMKAIRLASSKFGKSLYGCTIISTHEPCPMCSTAIFWSGIEEAAFGYSIKESIEQGRSRINIPLEEIFSRAGKRINIYKNILYDKCSVLYNKSVRDDIKMLRNADENRLKELGNEKCIKRLEWAKKKNINPDGKASCGIDDAYILFLDKLGITRDEAPIVERNKNSIVIHSKNFCPTLEACGILDMDTRLVCRHLTEKATTELIRRLNPKLLFKRNYNKIRPHTSYCEEMIILEE
ncbi:MAG: nucleoside deaminase [Spirochaetota bacterium]